MTCRLRRLRLMLAVALLTLTPYTARATPAGAARLSLTITSTMDAPDARPGDGICADSSGQCTLRAAVQEANARPAGSSITIVAPSGVYTLTLGSLQVLTNTITLIGFGAATTIINGDGADRVALIGPHSTATLTGVTITGGYPGSQLYGGGLLNTGRLTLRDDIVSGNTATAGGGLANSGGIVTIERSVISYNTALYYGGGGIQNGGPPNLPGTVTVRDSTIENNQGGGDGGGILNGQNGHPASVEGPASAVIGYCARILLCASAPAVGAHRPSALLPQAPPAGLVVVVMGSRIAANVGRNSGGGIANDGGTVLLQSSTIDGNQSPAAVGGGISTYGDMTVVGSTLSHNQAVYGGGIEGFSGGLSGGSTVIRSTLSSNMATTGGAIDANSAITTSGSTLSGNQATANGGGVEVEGSSVMLVDTTLSGNTAPAGQGGGVQTYGCGNATLTYVTLAANSSALALSCPTLTLHGAIVASSVSGANCVGARPSDGGANLDSGASCGFSQTTDITDSNPLLGPLRDNGGPTQTMALLPGSPAINRGDRRADGCLPTDQRGARRPDTGETRCDMGAYEAQGVG